jgi:hypothetical protein
MLCEDWQLWLYMGEFLNFLFVNYGGNEIKNHNFEAMFIAYTFSIS